MTTWDPAQYAKFAGERGRAFVDLIARIDVAEPAYVVDAGCGDGSLTRLLSRRWPNATVEAFDSSPEMVSDGFSVADVRTWMPDRPVDVLVSNAVLQWVPGHLELLGRLVSFLAPGGCLAFQVPGNFGEASHTLLHALQEDPRFRPVVGRHQVEEPFSHEPVEYLEALAALGCRADVWETTYLHVLHGEDAVFEWVKGTGARPVLRRLEGAGRETFIAEYKAALHRAYPRSVLPFRRIFAVATAASAVRT